MPEPGTIPDPRMNPIGERPFGTAFNHEDGHYYYYIKGRNDQDPELPSRFLSAGTLVELDNVYPAFLVVPKLSKKEIQTYRFLDYDKQDSDLNKDELALKTKLSEIGKLLVSCVDSCEELKSFAEVEHNWKKAPAMIDLVEVTRMRQKPKQKVMEKVNKHIKEVILLKESK